MATHTTTVEQAPTSTSAPSTASEAKVKGRVKVSIHLGTSIASTTVKSSHQEMLPIIIPHEIGKFAHIDRPYYTLFDWVGYPLNEAIFRTRTTVPVQIWTDILVSFIAGNILLNQQDATTDASVLSKPAYLAVGDELYKLSPSGLLTGNRALKTLKTQIMDKAKSEAETIVSDAKQVAQQIAVTTKANRDSALRMIEDAKQAGKLFPPKWATDNAVMCSYNRGTGMWSLGFFIRYAPKMFAFEFNRSVKDTKSATGYRMAWMRKQWHSNHGTVSPVLTLMWVPLNAVGKYAVSAIHVDINFKTLPHNSHVGSCMGLSTAPDIIETNEQFRTLSNAVQACLNETVEMHSLYAAESLAHEDIAAFIPGKNATERAHFVAASRGRWLNAKGLRAGLADYPADEEYEIKTKGEAPPNTEFTI